MLHVASLRGRAEEDARSGTERVVWVASTPGCSGTNWEQTFSSLISLWSHISVVRFEFGIAASSASAPMSPICDTNKQRATCIQRTTKHATAMQLTTQPQHCNRADVADLGRRRARLLRNTCACPRTRAAVGYGPAPAMDGSPGRVLGNGGGTMLCEMPSTLRKLSALVRSERKLRVHASPVKMWTGASPFPVQMFAWRAQAAQNGYMPDCSKPH